MNFDINQMKPLLDSIQYPVGKSHLIQMAKQRGLNDQMVGMLEQVLPDKQFESAQELQDTLSGMMGGLGNLGNLGGLKF